MITIGITGGIGSGKSVVCQIFKLLGIPVFEADIEAKKLYETNNIIKQGLVEIFGKNIYNQNNTLNRVMLANLIFNDDNLLEKVNLLVHPEVRNEFENWKKKQDSPYLIHEAAILFESGFYKMMDQSILVTAPEELRIERVSKRDNVSPEVVIKRMKKQWTDDEKRKLASFELVNDNKCLLIPMILEIDNNLKTYGKIW